MKWIGNILNKKTIVTVAFAFLLSGVLASETFAVSFTFSGNIGGQEKTFTVYGDVGGSSNIIYQGVVQGQPRKTWNEELPINKLPDWINLNTPFDVNHYGPISQNFYSQMYLDSDMDHLNRGFFYNETINGTLGREYWRHSVRIENTLVQSGPVDSLIGINGIFSYHELIQYSDEYTWGIPLPGSSMSGILTLQNIDWIDSGPHSSPVNPVPEPSTIILLGLGLIGIFAFKHTSVHREKDIS